MKNRETPSVPLRRGVATAPFMTAEMRRHVVPSRREPLSLQVCDVAYFDPLVCYIELGL